MNVQRKADHQERRQKHEHGDREANKLPFRHLKKNYATSVRWGRARLLLTGHSAY
jgi:hypothetical protein